MIGIVDGRIEVEHRLRGYAYCTHSGIVDDEIDIEHRCGV